jgi:DNA-binding HxlR family transcriptional regulator
MAKKGLGRHQKDEARDAEHDILKVLEDQEWHRYQDLYERIRSKRTKFSTATLSKHLKELEKGLVERKVDSESKEYPKPVYYRIKQAYLTTLDERRRKTLEDNINNSLRWIDHDKPDIFVQFFNSMVTFQLLSFMKGYFINQDSEEAFNQGLDFFVISVYRNVVEEFRKKLKNMVDNGVNVPFFLSELSEKINAEWTETVDKRVRGSRLERFTGLRLKPKA